MKYAKDGFKFYQVITTNGGNMEFELPENPEDFNVDQDKKMMRLTEFAIAHQASISSSHYERL